MLRLCPVNCLLSTLCQQSCHAMRFATLLCMSAECLSITGLDCSHNIGTSLFPVLPPQVGSVSQRHGTPSLLTWTITQMPTAFVQLPPQGGVVRWASIAL